jgi:membrane-associated phospholipid phosphatase
MNPILDSGINFIAMLQSSAPWLKIPMQFFTYLGTEEFFLLVLPFLYWCVDVRLGVRVAVILSLSSSFNSFFKFAFHQPRPYWVSDKVQAMGSETSYGIPSGHAQHAVVVWGTIGSVGKRWLQWPVVALIFLIGFSRIVLAVHFPTDVLAGWIIGGLVLWAFLKWEAPMLAWFNHKTFGQKIGLAFATSLLMLLVALAGLAFVPPADPPEWETNAARFFPPEPGASAINPRDTTGEVGAVGTFFGLAAGAILLFHQGGFDARGKWWKRAVRFVIGVIGVAIFWMGLRMVFPRDASLVSQVLRYLRYAVTGFWVAYGAPWIFFKLKLAEIGQKSVLR